MYTYFLKKYDCVKLGNFLSKKCKVSFFAKYRSTFSTLTTIYNLNNNDSVYMSCVISYEPHHEKTGFLHMQKQRHRSASR